MSIANIAERFKESRLAAKLSQDQAAQLVGCKQTVVSKIEAGDVKKSSYFEKFANVFDVDYRWLMTGEGFKKEEDHYSNDGKNNLPILMGNEIVRWCMGELLQKEIFVPNREFVFSPFSKQNRKRKFAIKMKDDSMSTATGVSLHEGAVAVVDPDRQWVEGDFILVIESSGMPQVYKYGSAGIVQLLKPLNTRYPVHELTSDYAIVGTICAIPIIFHQS